MNFSRQSYTLTADSNFEYSKDVILQKCEFCNRTFIPDSLTKHRKVCYRDYLRKRSKISNLKSRNMVRSKSAIQSTKGDQGMNLTELMISRQLRRMTWRSRHEEFIQTIRDARNYAIAQDCGISTAPPTSSLDHRDDMKRCKYCLRHFHKETILRHSMLCKEHSLQSYRLKPSSAHMEAKRRMSLRLYYKPKSFRGDSPGDETTTISSHDLDNDSMATFNSKSTRNAKDRDIVDISQCSFASSKSQTSLRSRTFSAVNNGTDSPKSNRHSSRGKGKRGQSSVPRKRGERNASNRSHVPKEDLPGPAPPMSIVKRRNIAKNSSRPRKEGSLHKTITQKLKEVSNLLEKNSCRDVERDSFGIVAKFEGPKPSESFSKAKEVLQYLKSRMKENEPLEEKQASSKEETEIEKRHDVHLTEKDDTEGDTRTHYGSIKQRGDESSLKEVRPGIPKNTEEELDFSHLFNEIRDKDCVNPDNLAAFSGTVAFRASKKYEESVRVGGAQNEHTD